MTTTPPHQLPTIREATTLGFRFTVAQWAAIVSSLGGALTVFVGACIWLYVLYANVDQLKVAQESQARALQRIEESLREIEFRQKYGITTSLPAAPKLNP